MRKSTKNEKPSGFQLLSVPCVMKSKVKLLQCTTPRYTQEDRLYQSNPPIEQPQTASYDHFKCFYCELSKQVKDRVCACSD